MKKMMMLLIVVGMLFVSGCVSSSMAHRELAKCPQYFRDNIGEVKVELFSPATLIYEGYVNSDEPNCPIYLYGLADRNVVWHEAFHSFEMRAGLHRNNEWQLFCRDFGEDTYLGSAVTILALFVPFVSDIPISGKIRLYSELNRFEDSADCFMYWMQKKNPRNDPVLQRKLKAVEKFVTGRYSIKY